MKRWIRRNPKVDTAVMAEDLGIHVATACVLANRGILSRQDARNFLNANSLTDASQMKDMCAGIALIKQAIAEHKKIMIYGDYDVDGVMSTTILYKALGRCGGDVSYYLPHRQKEGYGLNMSAVEALAEGGTEVLFTCDNGIAANHEVEYAKELGLQVVILDHHEPAFREENGIRQDILPKADIIIDPKQKACGYPFKMLCAGGIAYKFALELCKAFEIEDTALEQELLVFAGMATVCDIVDLMDENRVLVQGALQEMQKASNLGLRMLLEETQLSEKQVAEYHLGFIIGPCINAAGRLESGAQAVELFCTDEEAKARAIARQLVELNTTRRSLTSDAVERIQLQLEESDIKDDRVFVIYDNEIHESIAGIVAGRIKDVYYRPVVVLTNAEEGAKGSARSIEGYHFFEALLACSHLFTRFGGHAMAAGLSLPTENIPKMREALNQDCTLTEEQLTPVVRIDKILKFSEISFELVKELKQLAPFGKGNSKPLFASLNIKVENLRLIGKNKDMLSLTLGEEASGKRISAVSFDGYALLMEQLKQLYPNQDCAKMINDGHLPGNMDFVYEIDVNTYQGRNTLQLMIKDFRFSK